MRRIGPSPWRSLLCLCLAVAAGGWTGCSSSVLGWHVRTNSTPHLPSFDYRALEREPVALFGALGLIPIQGNEVGVESFLETILNRVAPGIKVVGPRETVTRINQAGLAEDYARMRDAALQSNILAREPLRALGKAAGARYVFQPRLMLFTQVLTDRWVFPVFGVRVSQTRATTVRLALQLWDTDTGALLWNSVAEGTMQSEAMTQDPVYFKDIARVTLGSMVEDFVRDRTDSMYTPVDTLLNSLVERPVPVTDDTPLEKMQ
ncbi:conserved protein of unknown function [Nitrospira japonica]|uniref:Lipoprotein n=1 Tax=Nitrospira japonica TaxID=1325564 RepID=A0A1W1I7T0_9BACT|nr:hypothetical protein [Nitrospira japonica]SLM49082.1 conserved protein of unknown function [Nitrospira japonica]